MAPEIPIEVRDDLPGVVDLARVTRMWMTTWEKYEGELEPDQFVHYASTVLRTAAVRPGLFENNHGLAWWVESLVEAELYGLGVILHFRPIRRTGRYEVQVRPVDDEELSLEYQALIGAIRSRMISLDLGRPLRSKVLVLNWLREMLKPVEEESKRSQARRRLPSCRGSKYKGVGFEKARSKWRARLQVGGKSRSLGYFNTEVEAALAYDKAVAELGLEAYQNFGESW